MSCCRVGFRPPARLFGPITATDVVRYQGASGDLNPLHHDDQLARAAGFPAAFSVGMLAGGWLAAYLTEHFGACAVRSYTVRFHEVLYRGTVLEATAEVVGECSIDGEQREVVDLTMTVVGTGAIAATATAECLVHQSAVAARNHR